MPEHITPANDGPSGVRLEVLETAGLVRLRFYDDDHDRPGTTLLFPHEADALAAELRAAAQEVRDA